MCLCSPFLFEHVLNFEVGCAQLGSDSSVHKIEVSCVWKYTGTTGVKSRARSTQTHIDEASRRSKGKQEQGHC